MPFKPAVYHIPACPFSQRLKILLALKGVPEALEFEVVDITRPRDPWLLERTRGTTALPVMILPDGRVLKESLVLMDYVEDVMPQPPVRQTDPVRRAIEVMFCRMEGAFTSAGYKLVMNQDLGRRGALTKKLLAIYARLDEFLRDEAAGDAFLWEDFGWAEAVFTPLHMRFWFLEYYEDFRLPQADERYARVKRWVDACVRHPAAQQHTKEEIVKLYYDYAQGAGNGALLPGRTMSSFVFEPAWPSRPWPPRAKYGEPASDGELGLCRSRAKT